MFEDRFERADASAWKDYGTPTHRKDGRLVGAKGMVTILEKINDTDLMASAEANSDAEAGIILRFHDAGNYVVALYSPSLKSIFLHDRKNGQWGEQLGKVAVPEIGPDIRLTAAVSGDYAALIITDGKKTYYTPTVKVGNTTAGKAGLWLYQIGERQQFDNFELSRAQFASVNNEAKGKTSPSGNHHAEAVRIYTDQYRTPRLPSPQDWVLVLERAK